MPSSEKSESSYASRVQPSRTINDSISFLYGKLRMSLVLEKDLSSPLLKTRGSKLSLSHSSSSNRIAHAVRGMVGHLLPSIFEAGSIFLGIPIL
uniref:Uncharacterized protein n=1 Tax=Lepeophtheirus salmonis TaxID=72036 RepID=A0A0K2UIS9_LEPSM